MMLRRSSFKSKLAVKPKRDRSDEFASFDLTALHKGTYSGRTSEVIVPKAQPVRDEEYRRWVASLACAHCGIEGYSQCAHGDEGKGMSIKSSDDTCYPACGPRPSEPGCHWLIGTSGTLGREERRDLEAKYGAQTRAIRDGYRARARAKTEESR
jgi:hypothetical protein